ncbi:DNA-binding winged helix-turn-helix (wHTH) protein [Rahnella inusitata]|nr:DNA-binding winged helix-turn-helix (wHTH) protein [Rahnella inusitata]
MSKGFFFKNKMIKGEFLIVNGRTLKTKNRNKKIKLTIKQSKLLFCLVNGVTEKKELIKRIWGEEKKGNSEACYRKLVSRTRALLSTNGFPEDTIVTIPNYGLCVNNQIFNIKEAIDFQYFEHQYLTYSSSIL